MKVRKKAQEIEIKLAKLVSDLRLTTDYEDIYNTLSYLQDEITFMLEDISQLWDTETED